MRQRVGRRRELAAHQRLELLLGEGARPEDQLERLALHIPRHAFGGQALRSPRVEALEAGAARHCVRVVEFEPGLRDDEHLDVRDLVGHAA